VWSGEGETLWVEAQGLMVGQAGTDLRKLCKGEMDRGRKRGETRSHNKRNDILEACPRVKRLAGSKIMIGTVVGRDVT